MQEEKKKLRGLITVNQAKTVSCLFVSNLKNELQEKKNEVNDNYYNFIRKLACICTAQFSSVYLHLGRKLDWKKYWL